MFGLPDKKLHVTNPALFSRLSCAVEQMHKVTLLNHFYCHFLYYTNFLYSQLKKPPIIILLAKLKLKATTLFCFPLPC